MKVSLPNFFLHALYRYLKIQVGVTLPPNPKIQQTKMLGMCQRIGDWFLFGLVWQYSSIQKNIIKVGAKSWLLTCSCHITLSLPFYTDPDWKRELNFCNGYLSLLYFWSDTWDSKGMFSAPSGRSDFKPVH